MSGYLDLEGKRALVTGGTKGVFLGKTRPSSSARTGRNQSSLAWVHRRK